MATVNTDNVSNSNNNNNNTLPMTQDNDENHNNTENKTMEQDNNEEIMTKSNNKEVELLRQLAEECGGSPYTDIIDYIISPFKKKNADGSYFLKRDHIISLFAANPIPSQEKLKTELNDALKAKNINIIESRNKYYLVIFEKIIIDYINQSKPPSPPSPSMARSRIFDLYSSDEDEQNESEEDNCNKKNKNNKGALEKKRKRKNIKEEDNSDEEYLQN